MAALESSLKVVGDSFKSLQESEQKQTRWRGALMILSHFKGIGRESVNGNVDIFFLFLFESLGL